MSFLRARRTSETRVQSFDQNDESGVDMQRVLDALPVGVVVVPAGGDESMVIVNDVAHQMNSDYQRSALLQATVARASEQGRQGATYSEALDFAGVDAPSFVVTATPLEPGACVVVIEDVTERRQIEAIRRDFVTNVGHELRTPVGAIVLLAESLQGERDEERGAEMRQHIATEANRAATLVDELLDLSKVQTSKDVSFEPLSVQSLLDDVLSQVQPSAFGNEVELRVSRPEEDSMIQGIRADLVSAIGNLILNAIKYSGGANTVDINVSVDDEALCRFQVVDSGIGIPAQDQERIFERFYRVDRSRDRATGGSGIGLAIVRHVAANHGGWVSVESREGEGSKFTFTVPARLVVS